MEPFKDFILMAAISSFKLKTTRFQSEKFWEHSFLVGRCAEFLNTRFQLPFARDHTYIAGSACNIGKIVMAICMPDLADRYLADLENLKILGSWVQAEHRHGSYQHTVLGEIGAMFWGIPESISDAIAYHHKMPTGAANTKPKLYELIGLANQMSHWVALQPHQMDQKLFTALSARFGLSPAQAESLVDEMLNLRSVA
jgi:HD-like signal output (HDOD) protein